MCQNSGFLQSRSKTLVNFSQRSAGIIRPGCQGDIGIGEQVRSIVRFGTTKSDNRYMVILIAGNKTLSSIRDVPKSQILAIPDSPQVQAQSSFILDIGKA